MRIKPGFDYLTYCFSQFLVTNYIVSLCASPAFASFIVHVPKETEGLNL